MLTPWAKTIKKNTNSTQNKSQTHRAKLYEVTSFLSTDCELSTETCSKNVYSLGPLSSLFGSYVDIFPYMGTQCLNINPYTMCIIGTVSVKEVTLLKSRYNYAGLLS